MNLIACVDEEWGIGYKNELLVRIPSDQKFFRTTTTGKVVVMGRKTLDSFPGQKPLKNRTNIVITSNKNLESKDGEIYVLSKSWIPAEKIDDAIARDGLPYRQYIANGWLELSGENYVDYRDCFNWFRTLVEEYELLPLMVGYDRYSAQYLIQDMEAYGFNTDSVYQGDNLWGVLQEMEGLFKNGDVHCGNNDLLKVHMLNSAIKMSTERGRGRLVKIKPSMHIDLVAAMADAFCVRQKHYNELSGRLKNG